MKATYDPEAQALYVRVRAGEAVRSVEDEGDCHTTDYRADGEIIGYEFLLEAPLDILTSAATANTGPAPVVMEGSR